MSWLDLIGVLLAGLAAGTVNTIVGAGTLVTFPVLVAFGVPPLVANASNTVGLVPGAVTGAWGYRRELAGHWPQVIRMALLSAVGGIAGSLLVVTAPPGTFTAVVPWLLVVAAVLAAVQPRVARALRRHSEHEHGAAETAPLSLGLALGITATGVYGGYFGAAQGVVLISLLGIAWSTDLQRANGAKNVLAGTANVVGAVVFILGGIVNWKIAGLVAVGSALGGVLGARVGRRIPAPVLRGIIVVAALVAAFALWFG
ncbi:sulfite exporter TauE/SafE family protein [Isoptericola sp. b441]|uniref:Probable membrane transporter protein n=1 Tax=Actinotalea lenta TaxID=3064654 RepID=A0ABT9DD88_9CELL|nr:MULTISPECIES: sulfite exporter TauE/SafE family protein [unclassified Isoptericola]MDO8108188.1 sulfite exporter TauE/SafE family protein [Isoptericola sp. b441]MDO8120141.1 sulfite exporter TauE/SafE family protein [Isoptericola sp. b490]